jgi:type II secretory pathway pseudopilin PulG
MPAAPLQFCNRRMMRARVRLRRAGRLAVLGVTLIELLTVTAIVLLLSAIVLSIVTTSREHAKEAAEIATLHQLSLAGAMYHDESGDWPLSVAPLVARRLAPAASGASTLDTTRDGLANELAKSVRAACPACNVEPTSYRRSFIGPLDFGHGSDWFRQEIEPVDGAGWLVSLTESLPARPNVPTDQFNNPSGPYMRVLTSGGVVRREHRRVTNPTGTVYAVQFMFADGDDAWRNRIANER